MLGITCQHQFYEDSITDMRNGKDARRSCSANCSTSMHRTPRDWIKPEEIRDIQGSWNMLNGEAGPTRIDECTEDRGWIVFTGMDFQQGRRPERRRIPGIQHPHRRLLWRHGCLHQRRSSQPKPHPRTAIPMGCWWYIPLCQVRRSNHHGP